MASLLTSAEWDDNEVCDTYRNLVVAPRAAVLLSRLIGLNLFYLCGETTLGILGEGRIGHATIMPASCPSAGAAGCRRRRRCGSRSPWSH